ncbi:MAG: Hsp20/alpha crystallin family protein [Fulvivirga sp.]|uniref:Hsp20/alpha crystallin family protein n=1 Tax=Fulvivirga sp. TaxID=1931237 RepID=UPI0032EDA270
MTLIRRTNDLFPTFFDDFFGRDWFLNNDQNTANTMPAVNIAENADNYLVEMVAPGMNKKDFKIELDNQLLTISYEKEDTNENKDVNYSKREFYYQSFKRSFTLPQTVENDKIKAKYENGLLMIQIPKKEEAKQKASRLISIS